LALPSGDYLE